MALFTSTSTTAKNKDYPGVPDYNVVSAIIEVAEEKQQEKEKEVATFKEVNGAMQ